MTTEGFVIELLRCVGHKIPNPKEHLQAHLHGSEAVTMVLLLALKGSRSRAFYS